MMEINYKGHTISINEKLLDQQKAWKNLKELIKARIEINSLLLMAEDDARHGRLTNELGKQYLADLTELEYTLQDAWNFPRSSNYHTYQWSLPSCTCPWMDNLERVGTGMWVISQGCPYHGKTT